MSRVLISHADVSFHVDSNSDVKSLEALFGRIPRATEKQVFRVSRLTQFNFVNRLLKRLFRAFPYFFNQYWYWDDRIDNCKLIDSGDDSLYLDGYWQDIKLINSALPYMSKIINNNNFSTNYISVLNKINTPNSVTVHVRKGDYISDEFSSKFDVCDASYYSNAIAYFLKRNGEKCKFYFITNDIDWVRSNLDLSELKYDFVSGRGLKDYEEMLLIGKAKGVIMSNSTFSWWGVNLSQSSPNVICPASWFRTEDRPSLISPEWKRI
ncbi:alpha-1,2-fucosyltransferase [Paraglaciecola chathamensis]|uniref:Alpha-1,2-fucosyltransferase n=1 Tax=Paraglaciecola chathamensis TaxID=368405 RepID=A0ABS0W9H7_9ALTE|nr:alpha-1,2-fucosyltransferase [Paraglaciecola chathamensis]MBJ2135409.1 alpha-1,2-fucosyltransferase [Paraglaciecola chathamensis]